jgi:hypothetical protein
MGSRRYTPTERSGICQHCRSAFTWMHLTGSVRKHCSVRCREAHKNARQKPFSPELRTRDCEVCSTQFSYPVGKGSDRRICSDLCRAKKRHANALSQPLCVVEGCGNNRQYSDGICNSCYTRRLRTGTLERRTYRYRTLATTGYVVLAGQHGHPLANKHGAVSEHRKVLHDAISEGPHPCHWCGVEVNWVKGQCVKGSLIPDHLDGNKQNNARSNLVPSCNACNAARGLFMHWVQKHKDDPVLWAMYAKAKGVA